MDKKYKYNAFISYRHISPDKEIADKLQKMLENYKPPKSVSMNWSGKWHIFRDETELPTSSNLSDDIKNALNSSEFLIVVCSDATAKSKWCMDEIAYFKEIHNGNNSNIITIVADGNPEDVFPEELCNELVPIQDENGNITYHNRLIEPLAANVSADSVQKSLRKLKTEFLRIAAPLLGCGYDNLYNREQRKKTKKLLTVISVILAAVIMFSVYSGAMLWQINNQKIALAKTNDDLHKKTMELDSSNRTLRETVIQLEKKTEEANNNYNEANAQRQKAEDNLAEADKQRKIAEENAAEALKQKRIAEQNMMIAIENEAKANEQMRLAQIESSVNLSRISENLWSNGDGIAAIETVLSALPDGNNNRPVVGSAIRVLADEIGAFEKKSFKPVLKLKHDNNVEMIGYAGDGETIVTKDAAGVYFWSSKTGELKKKYGEETLGTTSYDLFFEHGGVIKTSFLIETDGSTFAHDGYSILGYEKNDSEEEYIYGGDVFIKTGRYFFRIDGKTGNIKQKIGKDTTYLMNSEFSMMTDTVAQISKGYSEEDKGKVEIFNLNDFSLISEYEFEGEFSLFENPEWVYFGEDKCYCVVNGLAECSFLRYDITDGKICNPTTIKKIDDNSVFGTVKKAKELDGRIIVLYTFSNLVDSFAAINVYDTHTSELIMSYSLGSIGYGGIYEIGKIYAKNAKNYCDIIFVVCENRIVLLNSENGDVIDDVTLKGAVVEYYYSEDGMLYAITSAGEEIAVPIRRIEAPLIDEENYFGSFKTLQMINQPAKAAYYNRMYALSGEASKDVLIYTEADNEDYSVVFRADDNKSVSKVLVNTSGTYIAIDLLNMLYVYDRENESVKKIAEFDDYVKEMKFLDDTTIFTLCNNVFELYDLTQNEKRSVPKDGVFVGVTTDGRIVTKNNNSVIFTDKHGNKSESIFRKPSKYTWKDYDDGYINSLYISDVSPKILAFVNYFSDDSEEYAIYDAALNEKVVLEMPSEFDKKIKSVEWSKNDKLVILFEDSAIGFFDTSTGKCHEIAGFDIPIIISIFACCDDENMVALCNDSVLYKIDLKEKKIVDSVELNNDHIKTSSTDYSFFKYSPEKNVLILGGWSNEYFNKCGYVIDFEKFDIIYEIDYYSDYIPSTDTVVMQKYGDVAFCPLYTAEELIAKGEKYIGK